MKRPVRLAIAGIAAGAIVAGGTLAGAILAPPSTDVTVPPIGGSAPVTLPTGASGDSGVTASSEAIPDGAVELSGAAIVAAANSSVTAPSATLADGHFLVGAARASLAPAPEFFGGEQWQKSGCTQYGIDGYENLNQDHVVPSPDDVRGWPAASPDCIYLGGFGIGPTRPALSVGQGGVWVRSIAISNGKDLFTYSIADTVGWFARYDSSLCSDCGILDVRESLATSLGVPAGNVIVGSTHTHAGADTYGGWGGVPSWYRKQLRDATIASVKQAVANVKEATLHVGEAPLRDRNNQRRMNYTSNADTGASWVQARGLPTTTCSGKTKTQTCTTATPVVATWSTFAAHPTIVGDPILHADWPGAAARRFESTFGGVGLMFEGGLGNVSISTVGSGNDEARAESTGIAIADAIAQDIASAGITVVGSTMKAAVETFEHPAMTNPGLTTLGTVGLFDREFTPGTPGAGLPGTYKSTPGENGRATNRDCSATGATVRTVAGAHRIGNVVIAFGPGELFSNLTEVVKEEVDWTAQTIVLGQTNDALGYIIQSFEYDTAANVPSHYGPETVPGEIKDAAPAGVAGAEYEEVFSIDRCMGDHVLEVLMRTTRALRP
ncbi:MAG TPA: hypothetical protein VF230_08595 [Acidimicrobiales bacterium]